MTNAPQDFRTEVLLSVGYALLGAVKPNLRGVAVRSVYPLIELRFIYETMNLEDQLIAGDVGTYVIADFSDPVNIADVAITLPGGSLELEPGEEWAYLRREVSRE